LWSVESEYYDGFLIKYTYTLTFLSNNTGTVVVYEEYDGESDEYFYDFTYVFFAGSNTGTINLWDIEHFTFDGNNTVILLDLPFVRKE